MTQQTSPEPVHHPRRATLPDLSLTQMIGGSLAAATAAALGSRLGLVGTIAGAAVGSVVTALAANLYTSSLHRARQALVASRALTRQRTDRGLPDDRRVPARAGARRTVATAGVVFAVAVAFLLGLQLATGTPVTGTSLGTRQAIATPSVPLRDTTESAGASGGTATGSAPSTPTTATGTPTASPTVTSSGAAQAPTAPTTPTGGQATSDTGSASPTSAAAPPTGG